MIFSTDNVYPLITTKSFVVLLLRNTVKNFPSVVCSSTLGVSFSFSAHKPSSSFTNRLHRVPLGS